MPRVAVTPPGGVSSTTEPQSVSGEPEGGGICSTRQLASAARVRAGVERCASVSGSQRHAILSLVESVDLVKKGEGTTKRNLAEFLGDSR